MDTLMTEIMKGREHEKERNKEVLQTIESHHGKILRHAAEAQLESMGRQIEMVKIISAFVPDQIREVAVGLLSMMNVDMSVSLFAMAAMAEKPHATADQNADIVRAVNKLIHPLIQATADLRKKEVNAASRAARQAGLDGEE